MNYSHAVNERLRGATYKRLKDERHPRGLEDRMEELWARTHPGCEGWQFIPEDAQLVCSCGEVIATEGKWGDKDA